MPWTVKDVSRHNKAAKSDLQKRQWVHVANNVFKETGDEARAIREANAVIARRPAVKRARVK